MLRGSVCRREPAYFITSFDTDSFFMCELSGDTSINIWTGIFSPPATVRSLGGDLWVDPDKQKAPQAQKDHKHRSVSRASSRDGAQVVYDFALVLFLNSSLQNGRLGAARVRVHRLPGL